jgi:hypothetical protein
MSRYVFRSVLRIRDVYPGSGFFSIADPGSNKKKEVAIKYTKLKIIYFLETCTKKDFSQLPQNLSIFNPKYCYEAFRNMGGIRKNLSLTQGSK